MMKGGYGPTKQLQDVNWGAFDHSPHARPPIKSYNYYIRLPLYGGSPHSIVPTLPTVWGIPSQHCTYVWGIPSQHCTYITHCLGDPLIALYPHHPLYLYTSPTVWGIPSQYIIHCLKDPITCSYNAVAGSSGQWVL